MEGPAVPPALDERAAEFRARPADRRVLVVLDDAATEAQVRPLLPGTAGSAALVSSRATLAGLLGAGSVVLDVFDQEESVRSLGRVSGPGRVAAEPEAAGRIARACAGLPLALRIAGARSAATPEVPLEALADGLDDESRRLDELIAGDVAVRASFEIGYRQLDATARRAYRRLGLLRTHDVPGWAVPALLDADPGPAGAAMDRLVATRLVDEHGPGAARHYRMHDLIRLDARVRAEAEETAADRTDAVRRALHGWLHLAAEAHHRLLNDTTSPPDPLLAGWAPDAATVDALLAMPLDWFETERVALLDAVRQAGEVALELTPSLLDSVLNFYATRYHPDEWTAAAEVLLAEATAAGDRRVAGHVLRRLAEVHIFRRGDAAAAEARAQAAVAECEAAGDLVGARTARLRLSSMRRFTLRPADTLTELLSAHADLLAAGLDGSAAHVKVERGLVQIMLLDLPAARSRFTAAAAVHERAGDLRGHATALAVLAQTYLRERRPADALPYLRQALALLERLGDRHLLANVTAHLGLAELPTCGPADALVTLGRALAAGEALPDPEIVGLARLGIGEAQLQLGDPRSAAAEFAAARDRFAQAEAGYWGPRAQEGLGLVAAAEGKADQARDLLTRAVQLAARFEPWRGDRIRATLAALPR